MVGYVYYKTNIWNDNEAFRAGMITLIIAACLGIIGVIMFILARKYQKKMNLTHSMAERKASSTHYVVEPGRLAKLTLCNNTDST